MSRREEGGGGKKEEEGGGGGHLTASQPNRVGRSECTNANTPFSVDNASRSNSTTSHRGRNVGHTGGGMWVI
jgi:hypothetical protein